MGGRATDGAESVSARDPRSSGDGQVAATGVSEPAIPTIVGEELALLDGVHSCLEEPEEAEDPVLASVARDLEGLRDTVNLEKLEIEVTDKAKDVFYAKVLAKGADGKRITIRIEPGANDLTNYSVKVGAFGDEHRSRVIYEQIQRNLGGGRK